MRSFAIFRPCLILVSLCALFRPVAWAGGIEEYSRLREVPLTAVAPKGWLKGSLETQRDGLTGHLEAAGYPFNTEGWSQGSISNNTSIEDWWPYEQTAYWVDGMERCGLLLRDEQLLGKAKAHIDYTLSNPAANGYLGPRLGGPSSQVNRWIHVVFFRALMAAADGGVPGIPEALRRHYLAGDYSYGGTRDSLNIEPMLWAYQRTGDQRLLELARRTYALAEQQNPNGETHSRQLLEDKPAHEHGVTFMERAKLGALLYSYTGDEAYLKPSVAAFRKIDKHHMLIGGVNVSSEHLQPVTTVEAYENCDISDYTWSAGYLLLATGEVAYADRIERAVFNAAPGSVRADFKALQYFSAPNQVVSTRNSFRRSGGSQMSFAPNPGTECCPGNVTRCLPNFAARLWMRDAAGALVSAMYAPSLLTTRVGEQGAEITVEEQTDYPFSDSIQFRLRTKQPVRFAWMFRIPGWAKGASLRLNGEPLSMECRPGAFARLERTFADGDLVTLRLPQEIEVVEGPEGTVSVVRGPLVYSLKVEERWEKVEDPGRSTKDFPAYNLTAASPWNYALVLDKGGLCVLEESCKPVSDNPWSLATAPLSLKVKARRLPSWVITPQEEVAIERWDVERDPVTNKVTRWYIASHDRVKGRFLFTPEVPSPDLVSRGLDPETVPVTLVPYGCAKLRITYFPVAR